MLPANISDWFARRTSSFEQWPPDTAAAAKGGTRISVVLPARNEEATVGGIVAAIRHALMEETALVDELVVIDSYSSDNTAAVAAAAGATVADQDSVLPEVPPRGGKGEALWKSLAVTTGDIIAFVDADIRNFGPHFVTGLVGPLLADPSVFYVKGCYDRPLDDGATTSPCDGGRVTELVARPLLNMCWPELSGLLQPLAGEYAGRRDALESVPFVCGYGVEFGLLVDLAAGFGLDGMAQVDLGAREHTNQATADLGRMSAQIIATAWTRLHHRGLTVPDAPPSALLTQFARTERHYEPNCYDIVSAEHPPMAEIAPLHERTVPSREPRWS
ncbi:MAG: glucosyl-3-phosphoglycerate synthase [Nocardiopsaceae bacterium]|nr:glucosyl-3-phosphoglycerate synthase [Nocardiopsaceae bacterium]